MFSPSYLLLCFPGIQPGPLHPSSFALEPDGHLAMLYDNRNFSIPIGIFQHAVHLVGVGYHIYIGNVLALLCIRFTSCCGVGSGVLSKYHYFF